MLPLQVLPTPDLYYKTHQVLQFPKTFPSSGCKFGFVSASSVAAQTCLFPGAPGPWHRVLQARDGLPGLKNDALLLLPLSSLGVELESQVLGYDLQKRVVGQDRVFPGLDKSDHCKNPVRCSVHMTTAVTVMGSQLLCLCPIQLRFFLYSYLSC